MNSKDEHKKHKHKHEHKHKHKHKQKSKQKSKQRDFCGYNRMGDDGYNSDDYYDRNGSYDYYDPLEICGVPIKLFQYSPEYYHNYIAKIVKLIKKSIKSRNLKSFTTALNEYKNLFVDKMNEKGICDDRINNLVKNKISNIRIDNKYDIITYSAINKFLDGIKVIYDDKYIKNSSTMFGIQQALHHAISNNDEIMMEYLLKNSHYVRNSTLIHACEKNCFTLFTLLKKNYDKYELSNGDSSDPYRYCVENNNIELLKHLIDLSFTDDLNSVFNKTISTFDGNIKSIFHVACDKEFVDIARVILINTFDLTINFSGKQKKFVLLTDLYNDLNRNISNDINDVNDTYDDINNESQLRSIVIDYEWDTNGKLISAEIKHWEAIVISPSSNLSHFNAEDVHDQWPELTNSSLNELIKVKKIYEDYFDNDIVPVDEYELNIHQSKINKYNELYAMIEKKNNDGLNKLFKVKNMPTYDVYKYDPVLDNKIELIGYEKMLTLMKYIDSNIIFLLIIFV